MGLLLHHHKRGIKRASADVGFMFTAYNLRRLMNIIDKNLLRKYLQGLALSFSLILISVKAITFKIRSSILDSQACKTFFSLRKMAPNWFIFELQA